MTVPPAPPWRDLDVLAATWRAMVEYREAQAQRVTGRAPESSSAFWDARAEQWRSMLDPNAPPDALLLRLRSLADPATTVLDVGAGAGRYALRLAPDVASVVAVEPSAGMRRILEEEAAARGLSNITSVASDWASAQVEPADIVVCSHVIYGVRDVVGFVRKLVEHARRAVVLAIRIDQFDMYVRDLWQQLHGEERGLEPTFVEMHALLGALGIAPNVEVTTFPANRSFGSLDEAAQAVAGLVDAPSTRLEDVRDYVQSHMRLADDRWEWSAPMIRSAIAWWTVA